MTIKINHPVNPAPQNEQTWTTSGLQEDFTVDGFYAGSVLVTRKSDGKDGVLDFNGNPRVYHSFR